MTLILQLARTWGTQYYNLKILNSANIQNEQETTSLLESPERQPCQHLGFSLVKNVYSF